MKKIIKETYHNLPNWLRNRYALSAIIFAIWISFFDTNSVTVQMNQKKEINKETRRTVQFAFYDKNKAIKEKITEWPKRAKWIPRNIIKSEDTSGEIKDEPILKPAADYNLINIMQVKK